MAGKTVDYDFRYTQAQLDIFFPDTPTKYTVVTKGRRFGATHGASEACCEMLVCGEGPILWGDTIHANIDKYFDRYFKPCLKRNNIQYKFNKQTKQLLIGDQYMDFRSADNPENWEGFGYKLIFINEAGIILSNDYLYTNAILPMLMDYSDSRLIAAGVPKGMENKAGGEHKFYSMYKEGVIKNPKYTLHQFSSYDNPLLSKEDVAQIEIDIAVMDPSMVDQEIYGKFIDGKSINPFASQYDKLKHEKHVEYDSSHPIHFSIDFNYNPFSVICFQMFKDKHGEHCYVVDEMAIKDGTIRSMADEIRAKFGRYLSLSTFTGDFQGTHKQINMDDNLSLFDQLRVELRLSKSQFKVLPNPRHKTSRSDCNDFLLYFPDFKINPETCSGLCRDMRVVQVDATGSIMKKNRKDNTQLADFLDDFRYMVNTHYQKWLAKHRKTLGIGR